MKQYTSIVRDKMLLETLSYGVGLYHSGLSAAERLLVQQLHSSGAIQVVVVAEESAWGLQISSHLVVVVDTKRFTENGCVCVLVAIKVIGAHSEAVSEEYKQTEGIGGQQMQTVALESW